jgi:adenylate kinase
MRLRFLHVLFALLALALPAWSADGPILILIGSPSAGKSTQAEILHKDYGMTVISADDLIAHNRDRFQKFNNPILTGVDPNLDPALNSLVEQALQDADRTHGVVLDGYPSSTSQGDFLVKLREKMNLPRALVIHLQIPDDEVRKRLAQRGATDIDQQLKDYHREFDFAKTYFPQTDLQTIDGTQSPEAVAAAIRKLLTDRGITK